MADVTTVFAAKDESLGPTIENLNKRLQGFQAQTETFTAKAGRMASAFAAFAGPIAAMGAAFLGARSAVQSFTDAINVGGQLAELSQRTGESAGNLAILQRAFQNAGSSAEAVGPMLNRLQRFMVEGANGGKAQSEAMSKLGMSFSDLAGKTPLEQMQLLAQRISVLPDPAQRSAAAMEIFGRSGGELLPLLRNMGVEINTARAQLGSYPDAVDQAARSLDGIGDAFAGVTKKAQEFITGALVKIAPEIEGVLNSVAEIDFAAFGMKLSESLAKAVNFFRGLWADPSQIFGLLGDYLNATFRQAGDSLVSAFLTAGNALTNFFSELVSSGVFTQLGKVLADSLVFGASKLGVLLIDGIQSAMNFFGTLWASVTSQGVSGLSSKLLDVVKFFASDFVQAMTNPAAFVAGKLGSSLADAVTKGAETYQFAFDSATGSYIAKARAGFQSVSDTAGENLQQSASAFGNTLVTAATKAAAQSDLIEVNLFGGAEAIDQVNKRVGEIVKAGEEYRGTLESSVTPAQNVKEEAQATAAEGRSFADAINQSKVDAQITSDLFSGLSDRMNKAVDNTSGMLDKMREAFHFGVRSEEQTTKMRELENKVYIAEREHDRAFERADRAEQRGQTRAAHEMRMRADADLTKTLEKLEPELKNATEEAAKNLEKGAKESKDRLTEGGSQGGSQLVTGATTAADKIANAVNGDDQTQSSGAWEAVATALNNITTFLSGTFDDFKRRVPQNALG